MLNGGQKSLPTLPNLIKEEDIIVLAVLHGKRSFELLKSRVDNA
jgi:hypothetical protein